MVANIVTIFGVTVSKHCEISLISALSITCKLVTPKIAVSSKRMLWNAFHSTNMGALPSSVCHWSLEYLQPVLTNCVSRTSNGEDLMRSTQQLLNYVIRW